MLYASRSGMWPLTSVKQLQGIYCYKRNLDHLSEITKQDIISMYSTLRTSCSSLDHVRSPVVVQAEEHAEGEAELTSQELESLEPGDFTWCNGSGRSSNHLQKRVWNETHFWQIIHLETQNNTSMETGWTGRACHCFVYRNKHNGSTQESQSLSPSASALCIVWTTIRTSFILLDL